MFLLVGLEQIGAIIPLFGDGFWSVELYRLFYRGLSRIVCI